MLVLILIALAFLCFLLSAFKPAQFVPSRVDLTALGLAFLAAAMLVPLLR